MNIPICAKCNQPVRTNDVRLSIEEGLRHRECPEQTMQLQLLVIDFGGSCVVRVEKGEMPIIGESFHIIDGVGHYINSFPELRNAIDGEKPCPRLENCGTTEQHYEILGDGRNGLGTISQEAYNALSTIAGKPLPIYEGGKWEWLNETDFLTNRLVKIWQYTR